MNRALATTAEMAHIARLVNAPSEELDAGGAKATGQDYIEMREMARREVAAATYRDASRLREAGWARRVLAVTDATGLTRVVWL